MSRHTERFEVGDVFIGPCYDVFGPYQGPKTCIAVGEDPDTRTPWALFRNESVIPGEPAEYVVLHGEDSERIAVTLFENHDITMPWRNQ